MAKRYTVAREVRTDLPMLSLTGKPMQALSFEKIATGLTRAEASKLTKAHNDTSVVFYAE